MATAKQRAAALNRARREYLHHPTRALLRAYLVQKARRAVESGHVLAGWDPRMCRYYGVDPNISDPCKRDVVRSYALGLVPFSTTGGTHAPGSYHKRKNAKGEGLAVDHALIEKEVGTERGRRRMVGFQRLMHHRHRQHLEGTLVELLGPDNGLVMLAGQETDLVEGSALETQHDTHVHTAHNA